MKIVEGSLREVLKVRLVKDVAALRTECYNESNLTLREEYKEQLMQWYLDHNRRVQGISLIQLGTNVNAALIAWNKEKPIIAFNLKSLFRFGYKLSYEGCESERYRYYVFRPLLSIVSYEDCTGHKYTKLLGYKKGRVFHHEYDHTKGILLEDKALKRGELNKSANK